jgi:hypothetical protein
MSEAFVSNAVNLIEMTESVKTRDSPLPLRPASVFSIENVLAEEFETPSRSGSVCSNPNPGHQHHHDPCDACERDKKEVCSP